MQAVPAAEVAALVPLKRRVTLFLESALGAGVAAIQELYRQRGFAAVDVKSGVNETDPPKARSKLGGIGSGPRRDRHRRRATVELGESRITGTAGDCRRRAAAAHQDRQQVIPYFEPRVVEARDALAARVPQPRVRIR